jgi:hypothetical protein
MFTGGKVHSFRASIQIGIFSQLAHGPAVLAEPTITPQMSAFRRESHDPLGGMGIRGFLTLRRFSGPIRTGLPWGRALAYAGQFEIRRTRPRSPPVKRYARSRRIGYKVGIVVPQARFSAPPAQLEAANVDDHPKDLAPPFSYCVRANRQTCGIRWFRRGHGTGDRLVRTDTRLT